MAVDYAFRTQLLMRFLRKVQTRYSVHSPFVYNLLKSVWDSTDTAPKYRIIEMYRNKLLKSKEILNIEDFGAGYSEVVKPMHEKTLRQVVKSSARGEDGGRMLYRLLRFQQPKLALELGANLGFSTAYQASALPEGGKLIAIEGSKAIYEQAQLTLQHLGLTAELRCQTFDAALEQLVSENAKLDYVLLDGHHSYEPTLRYYNLISQLANESAMILVDDIHWSRGMQQAWQEIRVKPEVSISIDLYTTGLLFLKRNQVQQHFCFFPPQ